MLTLRPYQEKCLDAIKSNLQAGNHRQLISLPTGAGKTVIFAHLIKELGVRALVLAHTNELLQQAKEKIRMVCPGLEVGIVNGYSKEFDKDVVISSVQSARVEKNLEELKNQGFRVVIFDEAHHAASDTSRVTIDELGFGAGTDLLLVGFTATAFRSDNKGLGEIFDVVTQERSIKEMIDEGYLCRPIGVKVSTDIDLSKVRLSGGDFQITSLANVMDTSDINQLVVDSYFEKGENRKAICFGVTVQHACNLANLFHENGVKAKAIYGEMSKSEREMILRDYHRGHIHMLCNCSMLTEGFDVPDISCVIVARPTQSRGLYTQMVGRGLRLAPNKRDCVVIDFCDVNHSICNTAVLLKDFDEVGAQEREAGGRSKEILEQLPPNLNQKLKSALIDFNPLGESFAWSLNDNIYMLKGVNNIRLGIVSLIEGYYKVVLASNGRNKIIANGLNFEYAFASAEDFVRKNREVFAVSDREAPWRKLPASEKQIRFIRSKGYRAGVDSLTRGQASDLISSKELWRGKGIITHKNNKAIETDRRWLNNFATDSEES